MHRTHSAPKEASMRSDGQGVPGQSYWYIPVLWCYHRNSLSVRQLVQVLQRNQVPRLLPRKLPDQKSHRHLRVVSILSDLSRIGLSDPVFRQLHILHNKNCRLQFPDLHRSYPDYLPMLQAILYSTSRCQVQPLPKRPDILQNSGILRQHQW